MILPTSLVYLEELPSKGIHEFAFIGGSLKLRVRTPRRFG
jgi:hypothetical protein